MKEIDYSDKLINMVKRKCRFPYEHVTSESVLKETCLASKYRFSSKLKQSTISEEDIKFAADFSKEETPVILRTTWN